MHHVLEDVDPSDNNVTFEGIIDLRMKDIWQMHLQSLRIKKILCMVDHDRFQSTK